MKTSVPKRQTFSVTEIVRKNDRERGDTIFQKGSILKKEGGGGGGVNKRETGRPSELRKVLSRKIYSIVM